MEMVQTEACIPGFEPLLRQKGRQADKTYK